MKSCSTTKQAFFEFKICLFITLAAMILYSESKYALGSSIKQTSAGLPSAKMIATLYLSPPESS